MAEPQYPFLNRDKRQIWDKLDALSTQLAVGAGTQFQTSVAFFAIPSGVGFYLVGNQIVSDNSGLPVSFGGMGGVPGGSGKIILSQLIDLNFDGNFGIFELWLFSAVVDTFNNGDTANFSTGQLLNFVGKIIFTNQFYGRNVPGDYVVIYQDPLYNAGLGLVYSTAGDVNLYGWLVTTTPFINTDPESFGMRLGYERNQS